MTPVIDKTPAQIKVDCSAPECKKTFVTQRNMEKHKEKFHKIVSALSQSPLATTVRTLFSGDGVDGVSLPSTQGDSSGRVNSPKVVTEGTFQCNECSEEFRMKVELLRHITIKHNKAQAAMRNDKDNDKSANKTDSVVEHDDIEEEEEIREIAEDLEDEGLAVQVEEMIELGKMMRVDKIVDSVVETVFREMNPDAVVSKPDCHDCDLKDEIFANREMLLDEKEGIIMEKNCIN